MSFVLHKREDDPQTFKERVSDVRYGTIEEMIRMAQTHQITSSDQDSVEISRNAKGEYSFTVKTYAGTSDEARERAAATIASLSLQYPAQRG